MDLTRKQFVRLLGSSVAVLAASGCGGGGDGYSPSPPAPTPPAPAGACSSSGGMISGNHGHSVNVPAADLDSATPMTYSIQGTATHDHTITLSVSELQTLKSTKSITVASSIGASHDHQVQVTCT